MIELYSVCRSEGMDGSSINSNSNNSSSNHHYYSGSSNNSSSSNHVITQANEIDKNNSNNSSSSAHHAMSGKPLSARNKRKYELGYRPRAYVRRKPREQTTPSRNEGSNHKNHIDTTNNPSQGD